MQGAKNAAAAAKESAANIAATAISGKEKTKATVQEKGERMMAHDPLEKDMATQEKEARINQAERNKQEAKELNAANKQATAATGTGIGAHSYSTTGVTGQPTGTHQMSAVPGHGTRHPTGQVVEGMVRSHPIGTNTGTGNTTAAHNTRVGGGATDCGTGGAYR